jgi:hypothetical protein
MIDQTMLHEVPTELTCPKDGSAMAPMGRRGRGGAYRCPECKGVFLDIGAMRAGRAGQPPWWAPVVSSLLFSIGMTMLVRRLRRRSGAQTEPARDPAPTLDGEPEALEAA